MPFTRNIRWCPLSKSHRTEWYWKYREDVSGAVVSVRRDNSTVLWRERDPDMLKKYALSMLKHTGHEEISLSSLSSSDYSALEELINYLIEVCGREHINISLPSLRIDAFSLDVMSKVQDVKKQPYILHRKQAARDWRDVINKGID